MGIPFSSVGKLFNFLPLVLDLLNILFTFVELSFEVINDTWDIFFDSMKIWVTNGLP